MRDRPLLGILLLALVACGSPEPAPSPAEAPFPIEGRLVIEPQDGEPATFRVAIADTDEERARGLMEVSEMPGDVGMVFLHDEPTESDFWMKDTLIPLTVAVWDESMTIRQIVDMEPCEEDPCPIYDITQAWTGAVEVNRGALERRGISVGATVRLD